MKRHKWAKGKRQFEQVCVKCGAVRMPTIGSPGRALDPKTLLPKRWCNDK